MKNKDWDERESELEQGFSDTEVNQMLHEITGDRCIVCNGVVDYHIPEVARLHLKMLSRRGGKREFWRGAFLGGIIASQLMVLMWFLMNG